VDDSKDLIDGGDGGDCIILAGTGTTTVVGGSGSDKVVRVPPSTSDGQLHDLMDHCGGPSTSGANAPPAPPPAWAAGLTGKPVLTASTRTAPSPNPGLSIDADLDAVATIGALLLGGAFLSRRFTR
jgi:hypothetical protein